MPSMSDHTQENFVIKLQLLWISYYMQKANFLPQIVFEILKFKKICNLIGLEYFNYNSRTRFFIAMRFFQILKGGVSFKTKKSHSWTKSFFKICIADFFQSSQGMPAALQIRTDQRSITTNLWPLTAYIHHVIIIVTGGFSKKTFF